VISNFSVSGGLGEASVSGSTSGSGSGSGGVVPDPGARPVRRSFTAEYRARVLAEYEAAPVGLKAAVLRREGLYQSHVQKWAAARAAQASGSVAPGRDGRAAVSVTGRRDAARLRAENERLTRELAQAQAVVEIMGKLQGLLETISESTGTPTLSTPR
jgi:transposase